MLLSDFYYVRDHERGPGAWSVVGPDDFHLNIDEKTLAAAIAALLSGDIAAAESFAKLWNDCRKVALPLQMPEST